MNLESYNPLFCVDDGIFGFFSIRKASSRAEAIVLSGHDWMSILLVIALSTLEEAYQYRNNPIFNPLRQSWKKRENSFPFPG